MDKVHGAEEERLLPDRFGSSINHSSAKRDNEHRSTAIERKSGEEVEYYRTTWVRWWVLFVFSFASFVQCLVWFTFSSVPKVVKEYYPGMQCPHLLFTCVCHPHVGVAVVLMIINRRG
jgi:hypothetical protein